MSRFVMGVFDDLVEECHEAMLHNNIDLYCLMVHDQQVEESRLKGKNKDAKRARPYDGGTSNGKLEIQDKPKFKKRFTNQVPSNFQKSNKDRVSNPKPQWGKGGGSQSEKPNCAKCGKRHMNKCLVGTNSFFGCGKSGHMVKNCRVYKTQVRESNHA